METIQPSRKLLGIVLMPVISILWVTQSGIAQWIFGNVAQVDSFTMSYAGYFTRCILLLNYIRPSWRSGMISSPKTKTLCKTVILCAPFGFLSNWFYYAGLSRSSLASSSTLSSTSTLFALVIMSVIYFRTPLLRHVAASFLTIMGVALIFIHDSTSSVSLSLQFTMYGGTIVFGDFLTLFAAFLSGAYAVLVQATFVKWCGHDADADQFVALNGVFIFILMSPLFISKLIMGSLPSVWVGLQLCIMALFGEVLNGMIWTRCTKWVSPLITSLTSTLLVPMSVVWDLIAGGRSFRWMYALGTSLIIIAFVLLCFDDEREDSEQGSLLGGADRHQYESTSQHECLQDISVRCSRLADDVEDQFNETKDSVSSSTGTHSHVNNSERVMSLAGSREYKNTEPLALHSPVITLGAGTRSLGVCTQLFYSNALILLKLYCCLFHANYCVIKGRIMIPYNKSGYLISWEKGDEFSEKKWKGVTR